MPEHQRSENFLPEEMRAMQAGSTHWRLSMRTPLWQPPTDVYETDQAIIVRVEVAGMKEDDFTVELNGRNLTIRGARLDPDERRAFHQMEIHFGEFETGVELFIPIQAARIEAFYANGFLRVVLPKAHPAKIHVED